MVIRYFDSLLQINTLVYMNKSNRSSERTYLQALHFEISEDLQFYSNVADSLRKQRASAQHVIQFLEDLEAIISDSCTIH